LNFTGKKDGMEYDQDYSLDPTAISTVPQQVFAHLMPVGTFRKVGHTHPFTVIPVPLSPFHQAPHLPV
jgi:hypothetical protein